MEIHPVRGVFSVCCVNKQPPKALQESDKHRSICGAKTIRARYIDGAALLQPGSPSVRQHPCREDTCSLCVSNHTPAVPRCLMASRSACHRKTPGVRRMRPRPASVPLGAVRGLGQMGYRQEGEDLKGRARAKGWCVLPLPIRAFNMPSRDPLLRTAHTSLGCQDNGQQASAVTPHFLCTELSNHDRCRQCRRRRHYQGPLHFLPAWPSRRPSAREGEGAAGAVVYTKKGHRCQSEALMAWEMSFFLVLFCFLELIADLLPTRLGLQHIAAHLTTAAASSPKSK